MSLDRKLVRRTILFGQLAFIELSTRELFVPLLDEVWLDRHTGRQHRVLSNDRHRFDVKSQYFRHNFKQVKFSWELLFMADPSTMLLKS